MKHLTETEMTDHEFAKWLKDRGWNGKVARGAEGRHSISEFLTDGNDLLAKVLYDNQESTHRIFC